MLLINAILGYVQETRADDALAALKEMLEVIVRVRRDGTSREVAGSATWCPATSSCSRRVTGCPPTVGSSGTPSVSVDESTFTGESVPVDKTDDVIDRANGATRTSVPTAAS